MNICKPLSHHLPLRGHLKSFGATHKIQEFNYGLIEDRFKGATRLEGSSYNSESIIILGQGYTWLLHVGGESILTE